MKPQVILLILMIFSLLLNIVKDGEPSGDYNAGMGMAAFLLSGILLYWGGFWDVFLN